MPANVDHEPPCAPLNAVKEQLAEERGETRAWRAHAASRLQAVDGLHKGMGALEERTSKHTTEIDSLRTSRHTFANRIQALEGVALDVAEIKDDFKGVRGDIGELLASRAVAGVWQSALGRVAIILGTAIVGALGALLIQALTRGAP